MSTANYTALEVCKFGSETFYPGGVIPGETIEAACGARAIDDLQRMGAIAPIPDGIENAQKPQEAKNEPQSIIIKAKVDKDEIELQVSAEEAKSVIEELLNPVDKAEKIVRTMTNQDALILVDLIDSRKSIKEAAKNRAKALAAEEEPEQEPEEVGEA